MSEKTKGRLSQRAAKAMNKPGFPDDIIENPQAQTDFVVAVSEADSFSSLPTKYQAAIIQAEQGPEARMVSIGKLRRT